eukprot:2922472-Rhodomonas_salina.1
MSLYGNLAFTVAPDAFGNATFRITLLDSGGTARGGIDRSEPQYFTIEIQPVNDRPTILPIPPIVSVVQYSGNYTQAFVGNWSVGPANEADQTYSFLVATDQPSLFAMLPSIDTAGILSFGLSLEFGSANVSVSLRDSGAGADLSEVLHFTISV